jgi:hypothetical protein
LNRARIVFPLVGVALSVLVACGPDASSTADGQGAKPSREYTAAQKEALAAAGHAILRGALPRMAVPPALRPVLAEVDALVPEVDVDTCLDRAGGIVYARRRRRLQVPQPLYVAAVGVSVVTREPWYQTVPNLIEFCSRMSTELSSSGFVLPKVPYARD